MIWYWKWSILWVLNVIELCNDGLYIFSPFKKVFKKFSLSQNCHMSYFGPVYTYLFLWRFYSQTLRTFEQIRIADLFKGDQDLLKRCVRHFTVVKVGLLCGKSWLWALIYTLRTNFLAFFIRCLGLFSYVSFRVFRIWIPTNYGVKSN